MFYSLLIVFVVVQTSVNSQYNFPEYDYDYDYPGYELESQIRHAQWERFRQHDPYFAPVNYGFGNYEPSQNYEFHSGTPDHDWSADFYSSSYHRPANNPWTPPGQSNSGLHYGASGPRNNRQTWESNDPDTNHRQKRSETSPFVYIFRPKREAVTQSTKASTTSPPKTTIKEEHTTKTTVATRTTTPASTTTTTTPITTRTTPTTTIPTTRTTTSTTTTTLSTTTTSELTKHSKETSSHGPASTASEKKGLIALITILPPETTTTTTRKEPAGKLVRVAMVSMGSAVGIPSGQSISPLGVSSKTSDRPKLIAPVLM